MARSFVYLAALLPLLAACPETNPDDFGDGGPTPSCANLGTPEGYVDALACSAFQSCVYDASCTCAEPARPYDCPAMQPWAAMTHATACGDFDGATTPDVVQGHCDATAPAGAAEAHIGLDPNVPGRWHLPDGHFIQPAGHDQIVHGDDVRSAFLVDELLVPGTKFAVLVDAGVEDEALYAIDLDALAADTPALVSESRFAAPSQLDRGLAFVAPNEIYASGGGNGFVYAFTIDLASGALARDQAKDLDLGSASVPGAPSRWYVGGLATTADPNELVVAPATGETQVRLVNLGAKTWTNVDVSPDAELFGVFPDTNDASQNGFFVTSYDNREVVRFDAKTGAVSARYAAGKNPEGVVVTPSHVLVANSDDDSVSVFDAASGTLVQTLVVGSDGLTGAQPSVLAYDAARERVYAALSGINAIDVYSYVASSTKTPLVPLGRIPTSWWPTALALRADGSLLVASAKGHGTGPATGALTAPDLTRGAVALVPPPSQDDLTTMSATVAGSRQTNLAGAAPTVDCGGKSYDFPVPSSNTSAPSADITHVVLVVRESKTFDSIFGDLPGVDGDPLAVLSPGRMDEIWANARAIAQTFTTFDDYGIDAESSLQGHVRSSYGRSSDYVERAWSSTEGRRVRAPKAGVDPVFGAPSSGSLFTWADAFGLPYVDMGETFGAGALGLDPKYPGSGAAQPVPDTESACYVAARARALCDLPALSYVVLPNDATLGSASGKPTPELMNAVNDVATGMILDAVSHSPMWPTTLVVVTEADPAAGEDHVDAHRAPLVLASPWVKRGYVSHTALGTAALHKLLANIFAKPYRSETIASAVVPFDAFTGTPDYSPYTYTPLQIQVGCNP